jgi:chromosome transmission fidelity protein 1
MRAAARAAARASATCRTTATRLARRARSARAAAAAAPAAAARPARSRTRTSRCRRARGAARAVPRSPPLTPLLAQIIFCSRTHSQLAQVVGELLRTPFAEHVRTVVLAGRSQLCVHDAVRLLSPAQRANDACAELQRGAPRRAAPRAAPAPKAPRGGAAGAAAAAARAAAAGCPFLRKRRQAVAALKELILAEPLEARAAAALHAHPLC